MRLLRRPRILVQPFLSAITTEGEFSLFYFNGVLSHTIVKLPKPADFRVQEEHGGIIRAVETEDALRDGATQPCAQSAPSHSTPVSTSCGRMDPNPQPTTLNRPTYWLMELELIEPSLYLRMDKGAPERFARALHERVLFENEMSKV